MATAVEPGPAPAAPGKPLGLPMASLVGAAYVLAALAVVFYAVPVAWQQVAGAFGSNTVLRATALVAVQIASVAALVWFGAKLAGDSPPKGVRGGIFLMISYAWAAFFIVRAFALNLDGTAGQIVAAAVLMLAVYLALRFFTGRTGARWMVALEEMGWFSTAAYKPSLGRLARRLTTLGLGLVGVSGVLSLSAQGALPDNWVLEMPFGVGPLTVLGDARTAIPVLLLAVTGWVAYRAVHIPDFAEFLIATEAEMNKVSWSTKKRLAQDTVVVLVTTVIMTLFLLAVDLFWGWLLSRNTVGVLPPPVADKDKGDRGTIREQKW